MYTALYRSQRPEVFSEILGQEHIVKILKHQIETGTVSHAYLFCGTRGTGKTTTARILAKAVNCLETGEKPCGHCASCVAIKEGNFMDVVEIDAASNNSVDNIRDLRESIKYPPAIGKKKVYIIDEVHMLSTGAFNALLKTLEEPPADVMFILATTEPQKLPATILSRCMRLDFKRVPTNVLADSMRKICTAKGVEITDGAVKLLANSADGSVRDGLSILDQVLAAGEKHIDRDKVLEYIGTVGEDFFIELTEMVQLNKVAEALVLLDGALAEGKDVKQIMKDWTAHYRNLLITKFIKNPEDMLNMSSENLQKIAEQTMHISLEEINNAIIKLSKTMNDARWSTQPRILLELAIVSIATDLVDENHGTGLRRLNSASQGNALTAKRSFESETASHLSANPEREKAKPESEAVTATAAVKKDKASADEDNLSDDKMTDAQLDSLWLQVFEKGEDSAGSFNVIRSGTVLKGVTGNEFTVVAKSSFAMTYTESRRAIIEELMSGELGRKMRMVCVQEGKDKTKVDDGHIEELAKKVTETFGLDVEIK